MQVGYGLLWLRCGTGIRWSHQLGAADNGVVDEQQALAFDQVVDRDQLHFRDQVPFALDRGHEGAGPGGCVFDKGTGKRDS